MYRRHSTGQRTDHYVLLLTTCWTTNTTHQYFFLFLCRSPPLHVNLYLFPSNTNKQTNNDAVSWQDTKTLQSGGYLWLQCYRILSRDLAEQVCQGMKCAPGLYAGPNYCQSHMFWWTHGCQLFTNLKKFVWKPEMDMWRHLYSLLRHNR